jgi:hypothetical protein
MAHIRFKILRSVKPVQSKSGVMAGTRCWKCNILCDLNVEFLPETARSSTNKFRQLSRRTAKDFRRSVLRLRRP